MINYIKSPSWTFMYHTFSSYVQFSCLPQKKQCVYKKFPSNFPQILSINFNSCDVKLKYNISKVCHSFSLLSSLNVAISLYKYKFSPLHAHNCLELWGKKGRWKNTKKEVGQKCLITMASFMLRNEQGKSQKEEKNDKLKVFKFRQFSLVCS